MATQSPASSGPNGAELARPEDGITKGFGRYLDTLRVGAYFGLLYLLVRPGIPELDDLTLWHAARVFCVVLFIILDATVRWESREQIYDRLTSDEKIDKGDRRRLFEAPCGRTVVLAIEIGGVAMFAFWSIGFIRWDGIFSPGELRGLGAFAMLTTIHNLLHIAACPAQKESQLNGESRKDVKWGHYFIWALFGDAFEITPVSGVWIGRMRNKEGMLQTVIQEHQAYPQTNHSNVARLRRTRATFHMLLQFCALHVVYFNLAFGLVLWCYADSASSSMGLHWYWFAPWCTAVVLGVFAWSLYYYVSCCELLREERNGQNGPNKREHYAQLGGNLCLAAIPFQFLFVAGLHNAWRVLLVLQIIIVLAIIYGSSLSEPNDDEVAQNKKPSIETPPPASEKTDSEPVLV